MQNNITKDLCYEEKINFFLDSMRKEYNERQDVLALQQLKKLPIKLRQELLNLSVHDIYTWLEQNEKKYKNENYWGVVEKFLEVCSKRKEEKDL